MILLRDQTLDEDAQVRFAEMFGPPAPVTSGRTFSVKHPAVMLVSNIRQDGKPIGALPDGEMHFHTDQCHQPIPAKATVLYAIEIPRRAATPCSRMPTPPTRRCPRTSSSASPAAARSTPTPRTRRRAARAYDNARASYWHPAVRTHPATGRKALYVNRLMTREIEGLPREESDAILQTLFDHQEQPHFVYEHVWRPGDILMWDNRCTLHARTDFSAGERRLLRRVTILGEKPV